MYRWLIFFLLLNFGCQSTDSFSGVYTGDWAETTWKYTFYSNQTFVLDINGHYTVGIFQGTYKRNGDTLWLTAQDSSLHDHGVLGPYYLIDGDSCIIDYSTTFDYCINSNWSRRRAIRYPQIPTSDSALLADLHWMLQTTLNSNIITQKYAASNDELVLESYYTVNENYPFELNHLGRPISIKSYQEIQQAGLEEWIRIDEINYLADIGRIEIQIMPWKVPGQVLAYFSREDGKWITKLY
ncbi:MAG: hypothetical protein AAF433_00035 [Bacteroidota bacterium]